ncbi:hypothetical protein D9757_014052 [Collybiopsis confluens]|uniref:Uncharacterized protein n=1 Tax=Collybiopsis confluens TaxID=2823264 RepID=A0A8H5FR87_9AGAR|nr:hypothetical protein D9757_014052 [Collybiopsis confluens]
MTQVTLVQVKLTTAGIESFSYGIFFLLTASSIVLTVYRHRRIRASLRGDLPAIWKQPMNYGTFGLAILVTTHWILNFFRLFQAFVIVDDGKAPGIFFANLRETSVVIKTAVLFSILILSDALIIYRVWVIWSYSFYVIIFPVLTLIGLTGRFFISERSPEIFTASPVCGIGLPVQLAHFPPALTIFANDAGRWITSDCVLPLRYDRAHYNSTNLYCTSVIGYKIWSIERFSRGLSCGARSLLSILGTFIESAAIYTVWTIFVFVTYLSGSNMQFFGQDIWPYIAGISFMSINVRVSLGWAAASQKGTFGALNMNDTIGRREPPYDRFAMQPVAVTITQATIEAAEFMDTEDESYNSQKRQSTGV